MVLWWDLFFIGECGMKLFKRFFKDERGIETSEYALMLVLIAVALIAAVYVLRGAIANAFTNTADQIATAT